MMCSQPRGIDFLSNTSLEKHRKAIRYVGNHFLAINALEKQPFHRVATGKARRQSKRGWKGP
jgi:hypothetical protein